MARKKKKDEQDLGEMELNMTPMIDVVFLLIGFFAIVSQLVSQEIAVLYLPSATMAQEDRVPDPNRFILNITREGYVLMRGERLTPELLKKRLEAEARHGRVKGTRFSDQKILVRADRDALYDFIQLVMIKCTEVGIFNIQFAAKTAKEEES